MRDSGKQKSLQSNVCRLLMSFECESGGEKYTIQKVAKALRLLCTYTVELLLYLLYYIAFTLDIYVIYCYS